MKKTLIVILWLLSTPALIAQDGTTANNCYTEYYTAFRDRGAKPVPDGVQEVVVSVRKDGACKCMLGKITVRNGVPVNDLMLEREDGTFERFNFTPSEKYAKSETRFKNYISNGMSPTYLSNNEELINLFFIKFLNDKPANYKKAPGIQ